MTAYYNEFDPKAASWLRQLIINGDIAPGEVDERSIIDVEAADLKGFSQHHFFAGIGVWSHALRNAGWSDDRPVCTASLPCQPFSAAGNQKGKDDERHLLPHFLELVKQCNFHTIFGEQVESAIRHEWLDDLQTVMERESYTVGHCVLGAHSVNSAHIRKRIYWVAKRRVGDTDNARLQEHREPGELHIRESDRQNQERFNFNTGVSDRVADTNGEQCEQGLQSLQGGSAERHRSDSKYSRMGNTEHNGHATNQGGRGAGESKKNSRVCESEGSSAGIDWLYCRDEKYRPIKSGIKPLVDGIARGVVYSCDTIDPNNSAEARTIRLKGYGNAIVAPVATEFIRAAMEVIDGVKTL